MFVLQVAHRSWQEAPKLWVRVSKKQLLWGSEPDRTWASPTKQNTGLLTFTFNTVYNPTSTLTIFSFHHFANYMIKKLLR